MDTEMRERCRVICGDCREVMREMEAGSISAIVTDPPYGLEFMGKEWDTFKPSEAHAEARTRRASEMGDPSKGPYLRSGVNAYHAGSAYQQWCEEWAREALRLLKPGGHLLAAGGPRTYHRMACAIEDAGFEIRDSIHHIFGSGFPKSLDVSKAIDRMAGVEREVLGSGRTGQGRQQYNGENAGRSKDFLAGEYEITAPATDDAKRWAGYGTALKPSHEAWVLARKPLIGTVAANVLTHGTGALNIDGCRIPTEDRWEANGKQSPRSTALSGGADGSLNVSVSSTHDAGRWPSNLVFSHDPSCGEECVPGCAVAELDAQSGISTSSGGTSGGGLGRNAVYGASANKSPTAHVNGLGDEGGASRFFPVFRYEPKAATSERTLPNGERSHHPTVKPVELIRWMLRLVTPPGGVVLDPFAGSCTTLVAGLMEGIQVIGIEISEEYCRLGEERLRRVQMGFPLDGAAS